MPDSEGSHLLPKDLGSGEPVSGLRPYNERMSAWTRTSSPPVTGVASARDLLASYSATLDDNDNYSLVFFRNMTHISPVFCRKDWIRLLGLRLRGATKDTQILKDFDEGREADGFRGGIGDFSPLSLAGCNKILDSIPDG